VPSNGAGDGRSGGSGEEPTADSVESGIGGVAIDSLALGRSGLDQPAADLGERRVLRGDDIWQEHVDVELVAHVLSGGFAGRASVAYRAHTTLVASLA